MALLNYNQFLQVNIVKNITLDWQKIKEHGRGVAPFKPLSSSSQTFRCIFIMRVFLFHRTNLGTIFLGDFVKKT